jgi:hypothetical protein
LAQILYYQYVVKRGLNAPWLTKMKKAIDSIGGEGILRELFLILLLQFLKFALLLTTLFLIATNNIDDHPSWGDLIWSYSGKGPFKNNDSYTVWGGGQIGQNGTGNLNLAY